MLNTKGNAAFRVTALYLTISLLWILLSDRAVLALSSDAHGLAVLQTLKGWLFVAVTGAGLYALLRRSYHQLENRLRELQRQQAALRESERRYRSFVENTSEGVYSFEPDQPIPTGLPVEEQVRRLYLGRIVACNDAMARMYGHPRAGALIGMDLKTLHGDAAKPENIAFLSDWIRGGYRAVGAESHEVDKDGNRLWFSNNVVGVIEDGRLTRVWGTQTDITERRLTERALAESEQRLRTIFEQAAIGVALIDSHSGRFVRINRRYCEMVGYSAAELTGGGSFQDITHPDDLDADLAQMARLLAGEIREFSQEKRYFHKNGRVVWVNLTVSPTWAPGETPTQHIAVVEDITDRKRAETALRESEEKYRLLVENQTDLIVKVDPQGRFEFASPAYCRMFGKTEDELLGHTFMPLVHEDDRATTEAAMQQLFSPPYRCHLEQRAMTADGWRWLAWADTAVRDQAGEVVAIVGAGRDVTERRLAEVERDRVVADLESLNEQLDQRVREGTAELVAANQELESFTYAVSHDLRAPIRAIHGFQQALREDYGDMLPQAALDYLEEISTGAARMNALIEGLLELSRATQVEVQRSAVDLGQLARELHAQFTRAHPQRRVELRLGPGLTAVADPRLLGTLLQNLLENAWKYTACREHAQVTLSRIESAGQCYFCVEDNGVGFEPEFAHRLFEPFQRLHRQDEYPGVGIGLATAQRIVRRHGGDIAGCGRPDGGARFCFTLGQGPSGET